MHLLYLLLRQPTANPPIEEPWTCDVKKIFLVFGPPPPFSGLLHCIKSTQPSLLLSDFGQPPSPQVRTSNVHDPKMDCRPQSLSPEAVARRRDQPRPPGLEAAAAAPGGGGGQLRQGLHRVGDLAQQAHLAGGRIPRCIIAVPSWMAESVFDDFLSCKRRQT